MGLCSAHVRAPGDRILVSSDHTGSRPRILCTPDPKVRFGQKQTRLAARRPGPNGGAFQTATTKFRAKSRRQAPTWSSTYERRSCPMWNGRSGPARTCRVQCSEGFSKHGRQIIESILSTPFAGNSHQWHPPIGMRHQISHQLGPGLFKRVYL